MTKNIFIEGIPGSGKSTLLNELSKRLPEHHPYHEGDICPVELAWCSYMTKEDFQETLEKFPDLNEEIIAFYREAYEILKNKGFRMIYLDSDNIREDVLQIKKERADENGNEMWFPLMMNFLKESPYGKERNYQDFEDVAHHFERRRALEHRIIAGVIGEDVTILTAKNYDISSLV